MSTIIHLRQDFLSLIPVSYTHLDVYKRQAYETFIGEIARKSAWKERIYPHRATAILKELLACEVPYCTPGGKPTLVNYSIPEIKRKFGIQA